jgi:hypothetical protein
MVEPPGAARCKIQCGDACLMSHWVAPGGSPQTLYYPEYCDAGGVRISGLEPDRRDNIMLKRCGLLEFVTRSGYKCGAVLERGREVEWTVECMKQIA